MSFSLPDLPFAYDALGPYMSRETLEYHHDKHHAAYVNNGNNAIKGTEWKASPSKRSSRARSARPPRCSITSASIYNHSLVLAVDEAERRQLDPRRTQKALELPVRLGRHGQGRPRPGGVTEFGSGWAWPSLKDGKPDIKDEQRRKPARPRREAPPHRRRAGDAITSTTATAGPTSSRRSSTSA